MTGWLLVALLLAGVLGAMRLVGLRGPLLTLAAAALAFGGAGYALQGSPNFAGQPREGIGRPAPSSLAATRVLLMGQFTTADRWTIIADSFAQRGQTADAVGIMRSAVRAHPKDYQLWVGLGNALADHARIMTPPAAYAFDRADQIAPLSPAPRFFRGLALVRSGRIDEGAAQWRDILATAPANASWRPLVEDALTAVSAPPQTAR